MRPPLYTILSGPKIELTWSISVVGCWLSCCSALVGTFDSSGCLVRPSDRAASDSGMSAGSSIVVADVMAGDCLQADRARLCLLEG
jgi:hypothetical protein